MMNWEIVLKGRGGMGIVSAGELLVKAFVKEGKYGQSIPYFGGERRGAPVTSYVRLSDEPIYMHREVYNPDLVAVFDMSLFNVTNPLEGLKEKGSLLLNTKNPRSMWNKTYFLDANGIADKLNLSMAGWKLINTAMLGAIAKVVNMVSVGTVEEIVEQEFEGELGKINAEAVRIGYEEVRKI
ncbi:2-oxoacid:acceptor oxidoreductase family protein [Sulfuracidifex metallicus DSM 6482 = JCM 9184]|uniref:pyruvate synthase n=2 Tax=Sulfuracidifex metallicus TaxID=47303 RepID=A0A6A9QNA8_SULME|nr:2-oxoacid:acceptor oxidoreductase family protein [Sulfuracidifex metallicus]MUN30024.1 pyruvate synthase [Sulfuracidifex metallicus DSM 6482 = JCM 9184]WOE51949.1 2-oxoacid:acceptor oxidoreductase family protein [Sulfuracidifex metallicus DSM 6482 = JCM 9184]